QGLSAGMYNNSTIDELKEHISEGHAVMVCLDDPYGTEGSQIFDTKDHYVIVTGFSYHDGKEFVKIRDPNGPDNPNASTYGGDGDYEMPIDDFKAKWGPN